MRQDPQLGTEPAVDADRIRGQREAPRVAGVGGVLAGTERANAQQSRTKGGAHSDNSTHVRKNHSFFA